MTGEEPLSTMCLPSKKSAEYSGYSGMGWKPCKGLNSEAVHSHPPLRSLYHLQHRADTQSVNSER